MFVLCVLYSKDKTQKPGPSRQRSTDKVQNKEKQSKARVCGRSLAGIADSNPAEGMDFVLCLMYSKDKRQNAGQPRKRT